MTVPGPLAVSASLLLIAVAVTGPARAQQPGGLQQLDDLRESAQACETDLRESRGQLDQLSLELSALHRDASPEAADRRQQLQAELDTLAQDYGRSAGDCAAVRDAYQAALGQLDNGCGAEVLQAAIDLTKDGRGSEALEMADRRMANGACIGLDLFELHQARGVALMGLERWDEASSAFTAALAPEYRQRLAGRPTALIARSVVRVFLGRPNMALVDLQEAEAAFGEIFARDGDEAAGDRALFHLARAFVLHRLGRDGEALADLARTPEDEEVPLRLALTGLAHLASGDVRRAADELGQAYDMVETDSRAAVLVGIAFPDLADRLEEALSLLSVPTVTLMDVVLTPAQVAAGEQFGVMIRFLADDPGAAVDIMDVTLGFRILQGTDERIDLGSRTVRVVRGETQTRAELLRAAGEVGTFTVEVELGYGDSVTTRQVTLEVI